MMDDFMDFKKHCKLHFHGIKITILIIFIIIHRRADDSFIIALYVVY